MPFSVRPRCSAVVLVLLALFQTECGDVPASGAWQGTVDTLANGAPLVSNPSAGMWDPAAGWRLVEELRIGSIQGEGPEAFADVAGIAVDDLDRIHVLDRQLKEVRVFGPDGRHVRSYGGSGEGPGELSDPIGIAMDERGRAWIADPSAGRYSVFDTAGSYLTSHPRRVGGYAVPWKGGFDESGRLVERAPVHVEEAAGLALLRLDEELEPADTVYLPEHEGDAFELRDENRRMVVPVPFTPDRVTAVAPDGSVWTGVNETYEVAHLSPEGDTLRIVRRAFDPAPVTTGDRQEVLDRLGWFVQQGGDVDPSRLPDSKPAYAWLAPSPSGHLWVAPIVEGREAGTVLDVFGPEGRYLGRVESPVELAGRRPVFRDDQIYGITANELGVTFVVGLRVERGGTGA